MWRIGIDEAGYGPNFGPLVMSATAWSSPADHDLWQSLAPVVVRARRGKSKSLLVNDSKKVYQAGKGLAELERTTLAFLANAGHDDMSSLSRLRSALAIDDAPVDDACTSGETALPRAASPEAIGRATEALRDALAPHDITIGPIASVVVDPPRFNGIVERSGSKGTVLALGLVRLVQHCLERLPKTGGEIVVDKHGGRHRYGPLLQEAAGDGWVVPIEEGMASVYEIRWSGRTVRVTFRPEADATSFEVALASIVSKYIRELCMDEFNAFWRRHLPTLQPTAGYPVDALRFLSDIRPTLSELAIPLERIWRSR